MIDYLEIRNKNRELISIMDDFISVIWHEVWFGVGDFEIYTKATLEVVELLKEGNYITRPNTDTIGIIETITITTSPQDGFVIIASGRFAKSILDRRIIYRLDGNSNYQLRLRGNLEYAIRNVVYANIINCGFDSKRNVDFLELGEHHSIPIVIINEQGLPAQKHISHDNLLTFTDEVLREYNLSAKIKFNPVTKKFAYEVLQGTNRSIDNEDGNQGVVFSQEYDNLASSQYGFDIKAEKNVALIGGAGEDIKRFYVLLGQETGLDRREVFIDASSHNKILKQSNINVAYAGGQYVGLDYVIGDRQIARLVTNLEREYKLNALQETFPNGGVVGQKFIADGIVIARKIYGEDDAFKLTDMGYKKMLDAEGTDGDYELTSPIYTEVLSDLGSENLSAMIKTESFTGNIEVTSEMYKLNQDYFLGDVVTIQDNRIGKYANVRITEVTEVQDENGYTIDIVYQ